jgi:predicted deacylase
VANDDYPIELAAIDISRYRAGNAGVEYVTRFDSAKPGPHVVVSAVVHGNELCGAIALDLLFREKVRPLKGTLTLVFCNVAAYLGFDPRRPSASRFVDEDFNRVWSPEVLEGPRKSVELERARELMPIIEQADFLLDIHSMQHATAPLMMCGPLEKGRRFAREIGAPEIVVSDAGHAAGRRMRDFGGFGDPASKKNALLIECGQHWERASADVAIDTLARFLGRLGVVDRSFVERHVRNGKPLEQRVIEVTDSVTIHSDGFTFAKDYRGLEIVPKRGTEIGRDGNKPVLTPYDGCVLIMPSRRLSKGQTAVRLGRFVE